MTKKIFAFFVSLILISSLFAINCEASEVKTLNSDYGYIEGDVNADGTFAVADVVLLQKWLLAVPDTYLDNWQAADFCKDGKLDVFDLTLMKRALLDNLDPSTPVAQPIALKNMESVVKLLNNYNLDEYPVSYRDDYQAMFERINKDKYVIEITTEDDISLQESIVLNKNENIYLIPYAKYEDVGILYNASYKGSLYQVAFYYTDNDYSERYQNISEYINQRLNLKTEKELLVKDETASLVHAGSSSEISRICAYSLIDKEHYYTVKTTATEKDLVEFLSAFSFKKINLNENTSSDPLTSLAQPIALKNIENVITTLTNHDSNQYPDQFRNAYNTMFDRFKKDGYIIRVSTNENKDVDNAIQLCTDKDIWLLPYSEYEDIGIYYNVSYKNTLYQVMFYHADPEYSGKYQTISEYINLRFKFKIDEEISINGNSISIKTVGNSNETLRIGAYSLIDNKHYYTVKTTATEEDLIEFLNVFSFEELGF